MILPIICKSFDNLEDGHPLATRGAGGRGPAEEVIPGEEQWRHQQEEGGDLAEAEPSQGMHCDLADEERGKCEDIRNSAANPGSTQRWSQD